MDHVAQNAAALTVPVAIASPNVIVRSMSAVIR